MPDNIKHRTDRATVDLSLYPDLIMIYLRMRVNRPGGLKTLFRFGGRIKKSVAEKPSGLLRHENFFFSLFAPHAGMRQYWQNFQSLERWARSLPHQKWWQEFLRDSAGTGFWHETYFMRGGMEVIYDDMMAHIGLSSFAPRQQARGQCSPHARDLNCAKTPNWQHLFRRRNSTVTKIPKKSRPGCFKANTN